MCGDDLGGTHTERERCKEHKVSLLIGQEHNMNKREHGHPSHYYTVQEPWTLLFFYLLSFSVSFDGDKGKKHTCPKIAHFLFHHMRFFYE